MTEELKRTQFYEKNVQAGAKMVGFGGWDMPIQYTGGIIDEHLAVRKGVGLFDVSHLERFLFRGSNALAFLQHVLTNDASSLPVGMSHYSIIANENGGAIDDVYLYRFCESEYLLVVNASNADKDWDYFQEILKSFSDVEMIRQTADVGMLALQGPESENILNRIIEKGNLPEPKRNALSSVVIMGADIKLARTGYTAEPKCFELFIKKEDSSKIWDLLIEQGASPIGLGARDTLRLEGSLPLYGHEYNIDPEGNEFPIFACPLASFGVCFAEAKGDFIGKEALLKQYMAIQKFKEGGFSLKANLPRRIKNFKLLDKGIARQGCAVYKNGEKVGVVTSGTMVPYWEFDGDKPTGTKGMRSIGMALIDSEIKKGDHIQVEIRNNKVEAEIVASHISIKNPNFAQPIL